MNFEDIKDQLSERFRSIADRVQESSAYIELRERYENLNSRQQRLVFIGGAAFLALLVFYIPVSNILSSKDYISEFEAKRNLTHELMLASRDAAAIQSLPVDFPIGQARNIIEQNFESARLLPEQIKGIEQSQEASNLIPEKLSQGSLKVKLEKLNLRQIVELGEKFQNIQSTIKLKDLSLQANSSDPRYFDAVYTLVALAIPKIAAPEPEPPPKAGKKPSRTKAAGDNE